VTKIAFIYVESFDLFNNPKAIKTFNFPSKTNKKQVKIGFF